MTDSLNDILSKRNPFDWERPENIDAHPMRYHPLESAIESIILTRLHQHKVDGYVLEMAVQIAEAAQIAMLAARNEALEEAAAIAESFQFMTGDNAHPIGRIAADKVSRDIRALKSIP